MKLLELFDYTSQAIELGFSPLLEREGGAPKITPLVNQAHNKPGGSGFVTREDRQVMRPDGATVRVRKGTTVFITQPGTMYSGADIGSPRAHGVYVLIGLKSPMARYASGYMPLSNLTNPNNSQTRVKNGAEAQSSFAQKLEALGNVEIISQAAPASKQPDIVATINGEEAQFEIKGRNTSVSPITFFDLSIRRGGSDTTLNEIAEAFTSGKIKDFEKMIDAFRRRNPEVGFPGDAGTPPSGKLPPEFRMKDNPEVFGRIRDMLIEHLHLHSDNYFAVLNRDQQSTDIFWTGGGPNPLNAPEFPAVTFVLLDTYGGAYKGAMRVGLKVQLDPAVQGLRI